MLTEDGATHNYAKMAYQEWYDFYVASTVTLWMLKLLETGKFAISVHRASKSKMDAK